MALSRRAFLTLSAGTVGGLVLGACSSSDDSASRADTGPSSTTSTTRVARPAPALPGDPFTLGVASGDPLADGVVLWTRLAPRPKEPVRFGMPDQTVDVTWEVASDQGFADIVATGVAEARADAGHSVHVEVDDLDPATDYWYRFRLGERTSPVGRTRTLAADGDVPDHLRVGVVTCQDFGTGYYAAYRHLVDEDLDVVVHLGDYVYEHGLNMVRPVLPEGTVTDLDQYRLRYATYKADPDLRAAHAAVPFLCMWDDHEVTNNYAGDTDPEGSPAAAVRARRAAAYRAWWENLPVRGRPPTGADVTVYRSITAGGLARITLLDERQYADEPPCRDTSISDTGDCADRTGSDREYLGTEQQAWFADTVSKGDVVWDLVGNPTVLSGVNAGSADEPAYYLETWDGYPDARQRFLDSLGKATGQPLILTGDYHAGMVADLHAEPGDTSTDVLTTELMTPAISSVPFALPREPNPHIRYATESRGYLTLDVEPTQVTATFRLVDDVADPESGVTTGSTWRIAKGEASAQPV